MPTFFLTFATRNVSTPIFMLRRLIIFCFVGFLFVPLRPLHAHTPDSLRLEAIIRRAQSGSLPQSRVKLRRLLKEAARDSARFNSLWNLCKKKLDHEADDAVKVSLFLTGLRYGLQTERLSTAERQRAQLLLQQIASGQPGHPAADFSFTARDGESLNLSELATGKIMLLIFFDPFCRQCQEFITHTANDKRFSDLLQRQMLCITAVNTDADRPMWERIKNDLPAKWLVGQTFSDRVFKHYDLRKYPSVYLLDKDRRVILHSSDIKLIYTTLSDMIPAK